MRSAPDPAWPLVTPTGTARHVEELYTAHARLVRSVCRSILRDRNEAEDAVQQTFLSAQRALANGSSPREPAAWLATIARNECLARVRERMREPLPVEAEPTEFGADAHSTAVSRYEVATLREALADLPVAQREAILLREMRGLSYDEVARALSVTTGAVESLIFRARRTLQLKLSEALAAVSPVTLFGRLLGGGGDLAGPAAAKVAAIGVGAAVLAGGAAFGPKVLGLAHGHGHGAVQAHQSVPSANGQAAAPVSWIPSMPIASPASSSREVSDTKQAEREAADTATASSDVVERSTPERSTPESSTPESSSPESSSPESSSPASSTSEGDTGTTTVSTVQTTPAPSSSQSGSGGGGDGGDSADSADTGN